MWWPLLNPLVHSEILIFISECLVFILNFTGCLSGVPVFQSYSFLLMPRRKTIPVIKLFNISHSLTRGRGAALYNQTCKIRIKGHVALFRRFSKSIFAYYAIFKNLNIFTQKLNSLSKIAEALILHFFKSERTHYKAYHEFLDPLSLIWATVCVTLIRLQSQTLRWWWWSVSKGETHDILYFFCQSKSSRNKKP